MNARSCFALALCLLACGKVAETGREATATEPPQRIVVIGPSTVANLFALLQGTRVVGVSDYCTVPEAEGIARVGGLADPSLERIIALHPDLVLVQGKAPRLEELCRTSGIAMHAFATDTLEEWNAEIQWLAARLEIPEQGDALLESHQQAFLEMRFASEEEPPSVLLVIFRRDGEASGMTVAGDQGFLDELLRMAGGRNVLSGSSRDYFELNEERLIRAAPDWILEFHTEDVDRAEQDRLQAQALGIWQRDFPGLPAVRQGNIRTLVGKDLLLPGPNMLDTARKMQDALRAGK